MNLKTVQILAAITAPVTFAAIVWPAPGGSVSTAKRAEVILPGIRSGFGDVAKLIAEGSNSKVTLVHARTGGKPEDGWLVADKANYPAQPATLRPVLDNLRALRGVEPKTDRAKLYSRLGLEDVGPSATSHEVVLQDAKGASVGTVILGRTKFDSTHGNVEQQYVRTPDQPRAWLAEPSVNLPDGALAWVDHSIIDVSAGQVKHVVITQAGGATLELARAKADDKLAVQNIPAGGKLKSDDASADIAGGLATLELDDVKPASTLTGKPEAVAHYDTFQGLTADISVYKQNGQSWITLAVKGTGDAAKTASEADARTKGWAYQVADGRATTLGKKLTDVVDLPAPAKPAATADKPAPKADQPASVKPGNSP
jgi:hypothetical protein